MQKNLIFSSNNSNIAIHRYNNILNILNMVDFKIHLESPIYLLIIHTKLTIEGNAQIIPLTQHNIKAKALNATHGSKLNC